MWLLICFGKEGLRLFACIRMHDGNKAGWNRLSHWNLHHLHRQRHWHCLHHWWTLVEIVHYSWCRPSWVQFYPVKKISYLPWGTGGPWGPCCWANIGCGMSQRTRPIWSMKTGWFIITGLMNEFIIGLNGIMAGWATKGCCSIGWGICFMWLSLPIQHHIKEFIYLFLLKCGMPLHYPT